MVEWTTHSTLSGQIPQRKCGPWETEGRFFFYATLTNFHLPCLAHITSADWLILHKWDAQQETDVWEVKEGAVGVERRSCLPFPTESSLGWGGPCTQTWCFSSYMLSEMSLRGIPTVWLVAGGEQSGRGFLWRHLLSGGAAEHIHFEETVHDINETTEETDCSWACSPNLFFNCADTIHLIKSA